MPGKNKRWFVVMGIGMLLAGGWRGSAAGVDMGEVRGILADADERLEMKAAGELAGYLERMFGVRIPVNPAGVTPDAREPLILLGRGLAEAGGWAEAAELDALKHDGFLLRVGGNRIVVAGYAGRGVLYGIYGLLEEWGCRFFSSRIQVIPEWETTVVEAFERTDKPVFHLRSGRDWFRRVSVDAFGDPRHAENPEWFGPGSGSSLWINHTHGYLVPIKGYYDEHPEYFARDRDGNPMPRETRDHQVFLCTTHPEVIRISTERMLRWMRLQPDRRYFFVQSGDGPAWCQCEACLAMDVEPGNYSDRNIAFVNTIARGVRDEFPENVIVSGAYLQTIYPPVSVKPEPNVLLFYAPYFGFGRSMLHPVTHPLNRLAYETLLEWLPVARENQMAITNYAIGYTPSWDFLAENLAWYADHGILAIRFLGSPTCFRDLFDYMAGRLSWNPYQDARVLKQEFVTAAYGEAAPHILRYLDRLGERLRGDFPKMVYEDSMPPDFYSVEFVRDSLEDFRLAREAAGGDDAVAGRIAHERELFLRDYRISIRFGRGGECGRGIVRPDPTEPRRRQSLAVFKTWLRERLDGLAALKPTDEAERERRRRELREEIRRYAHLDLPETVDPMALGHRFIEDPGEVRSKYGVPPRVPRAPEPLPGGGVRLTGSSFTEGRGPMRASYFCEPRDEVMVVGTVPSPRRSRMRAGFDLPARPEPGAVLRIEGQDADKDIPPVAHIAILVNDEEIYSGPCGFVKRGWSWRDFPIPDGLLKKDGNVLEIHNVTHGPRVDLGRMDHYWFMLSEARILFEERR